ncbi:probable N-acetylglucosaminyl-phosphatidylinositol de-N-acetylase [Daphnia magna]|uniref:probable N-acetylglucosaminyl-phosphatidylinositol de-N-acetylase n=1 Tax=Daphnia magna TaxID=35525 RepID=UPI001E1BB26C|nr:probable N-acetylglucosaminyl-phosphatidylinositol de-N-acetylase [Daphnia magna]
MHVVVCSIVYKICVLNSRRTLRGSPTNLRFATQIVIMCWYLLLIFGIWIFVSFLTYRYLIQKKNLFQKEVFFKKPSNVLFVIAHPDDECMFFGPSITAMVQPSLSNSSSRRKQAKDVYILCLSDGNANGLGEARREELKKSCKILGLADSNVLIHNGPVFFEDSQNSVWDSKAVADTLHLYIKKLNIDSIITFDKDGISGHLNHKSIYHGVLQLMKNSKRRVAVRVFILETVSVFRKYLGFIDSVFIKPNALICTSDWINRTNIQNAMAAHKSQYVWFRRLYITFSRYLFFNTFIPLEIY